MTVARIARHAASHPTRADRAEGSSDETSTSASDHTLAATTNTRIATPNMDSERPPKLQAFAGTTSDASQSNIATAARDNPTGFRRTPSSMPNAATGTATEDRSSTSTI